jgi:hypothetical protein
VRIVTCRGTVREGRCGRSCERAKSGDVARGFWRSGWRPRNRILQLLEELSNLQTPNLRICVTSRPEFDIRDFLEPLTSRRVSLHDQSGQRQDIADYVRVTGDEKSGRRTGGKGRVGRWDGGVFGVVSGEWADWG